MIYVLTLNWNGLEKLKILFPGLQRNLQLIGQDWEWYVRDNGSCDGSAEWLQSQINTIIVSPGHNRANFAQGVNSLLTETEISDEDFVLFLNNDIMFGDDESLARMLRLFAIKKVGIVGARLLYKGTDQLQHAGVIFGPRYGNMPYHFRHQERSDKYAQRNREFQAVTAACCLIRGAVFTDIPKLDEKFSWAFEDIDFSLRVRELGWRVVYCGQTNIFHEESASLKKNPVNKLFLSQNVAHFKNKWMGKYELDHEKYLADPHHNEIRQY